MKAPPVQVWGDCAKPMYKLVHSKPSRINSPRGQGNGRPTRTATAHCKPEYAIGLTVIVARHVVVLMNNRTLYVTTQTWDSFGHLTVALRC